MKKKLVFAAIISSFLFFQIAGAATDENAGKKEADTGTATEKVRIPDIFGQDQIKGWEVIDSSNIIIDTHSYGKYKATFMQSCNGIPFTETIGLKTQGPYSLDDSTTILLSSGETCVIKDLTPYNENKK